MYGANGRGCQLPSDRATRKLAPGGGVISLAALLSEFAQGVTAESSLPRQNLLLPSKKNFRPIASQGEVNLVMSVRSLPVRSELTLTSRAYHLLVYCVRDKGTNANQWLIGPI